MFYVLGVYSKTFRMLEVVNNNKRLKLESSSSLTTMNLDVDRIERR